MIMLLHGEDGGGGEGSCDDRSKSHFAFGLKCERERGWSKLGVKMQHFQ